LIYNAVTTTGRIGTRTVGEIIVAITKASQSAPIINREETGASPAIKMSIPITAFLKISIIRVLNSIITAITAWRHSNTAAGIIGTINTTQIATQEAKVPASNTASSSITLLA
jgi:hypothetical protein